MLTKTVSAAILCNGLGEFPIPRKMMKDRNVRLGESRK